MAGDYKHSVQLVDLPSECLLHLLSYVNYTDLSSCSKTCRRLRDISRDDILWKRPCRVYFMKTVCSAGTSWYDYFVKLFSEFGAYIDCYHVIRTAWDKVEKYLREFCPQLLEFLNGPASEEIILEAERKMSTQFPTDLRCSLRMHDGQVKGGSIGLFGSVIMSNHCRSEHFVSVTKMAANFQAHGICRGCVPFTFCPYSKVMQLIAISEEGGFKLGQIFYPSSTFTFNDHWNNVEQYMGEFISANSFTEWLTNFAQELEDDIYPRMNNNFFRWYNNPSCVAVSEDMFTVGAATCFMPELSTINPPSFFTAYRITMSMDEEAHQKHSCQLETRHWNITDADGLEEIVDGPGVVGEFPIMTPGSKFSWVSCTTFATTYGNMRGHFNMKNLQSGEHIQIMCPCFHMKCLPYQTIEDRGIKETRSNEFRNSKTNIIHNILEDEV